MQAVLYFSKDACLLGAAVAAARQLGHALHHARVYALAVAPPQRQLVHLVRPERPEFDDRHLRLAEDVRRVVVPASEEHNGTRRRERPRLERPARR